MTKLLEEAITRVKQLPESEQEKIAQLMLKELENLTFLLKQKKKKKLSDLLLLPEVEDDEVLCERHKDTGREITL